MRDVHPLEFVRARAARGVPAAVDLPQIEPLLCPGLSTNLLRYMTLLPTDVLTRVYIPWIGSGSAMDSYH